MGSTEGMGVWGATADVVVDVDHNPYLAGGAGTVDAIVSVAVGGGTTAGAARPDRVEVVVVDCSTSMQSPVGKFDAAKRATAAAIAEIVDGTHFAIVAGTEQAAAVYPIDGRSVVATPATRASATRAVDGLRPGGGTAMGAWLAYVRDVVDGQSAAITHAILLTDGKDEHETPDRLRDEIALSEGLFTCDCRGVGTEWRVAELRSISSALLGTVDIVADPDDLAADFAAMMRTSMAKSIPNLVLRLWIPAGARVGFVKQVAPSIDDLTHRRVDSGGQTGEYPLGSWGAEERDYHVRIEVEPAAVGREKLAARLNVVAGGEVLGEGLVMAVWTADTRKSARISRRVAHYTGQAELATSVEEGMRAKADGDVVTATAKLKRAMDLAVESGNDVTVTLLAKVIEIDGRTGTARLRRDVAAADEMALDARSTRTARVRRER